MENKNITEGIDYNAEFRLSSSLNDFNYIDENGNEIKNPNQYFEERNKAMITNPQKCSIGDVVVLKGTGRHIKISDLNYEVTKNIIFDYAGYDIYSLDERKYFFSQKDISSIVEQKHR